MVNVAKEVADRVAGCILRSGRSKASVARAVGIPMTTFNRKLDGHTEFTFSDLARIALELGVRPSSFTPELFATNAFTEAA